jgi:hypothetical protein
MFEWERNTPWRQGNVVPIEVAKILDLLPKDAPDEAIFVVISHDCDLAQPPGTEANVEIIVGHLIPSVDGNFSYAKNARRLHLTFNGGASHISVDLLATQKLVVQKVLLAGYAPADEIRLTAIELTILQRWLAARYRRSAFPDEFDKRLEDTGLHNRISKILKTSSDMISAVYFDVDEGQDLTKSGADDVYSLGIYLLYSTEKDPNAAESVAKAAKDAIKKAFQEKCFTKASGAWHDIELVECEAIADRAMTVQQAELLKRWSADHLSLRTSPPQPMLKEG